MVNFRALKISRIALLEISGPWKKPCLYSTMTPWIFPGYPPGNFRGSIMTPMKFPWHFYLWTPDRGDNRVVKELCFEHVNTKTWAYFGVFGSFRKSVGEKSVGEGNRFVAHILLCKNQTRQNMPKFLWQEIAIKFFRIILLLINEEKHKNTF